MWRLVEINTDGSNTIRLLLDLCIYIYITYKILNASCDWQVCTVDAIHAGWHAVVCARVCQHSQIHLWVRSGQPPPLQCQVHHWVWEVLEEGGGGVTWRGASYKAGFVHSLTSLSAFSCRLLYPQVCAGQPPPTQCQINTPYESLSEGMKKELYRCVS